MRGKIFLDTNVIVYAYDSTDPEKQGKAQKILRDGMISGDLVVSAQVVGELFVVLTRKIPNPMTTAEAASLVQALGKLTVVEIGFVTVSLAVHIVMKGAVSYWDALIIAAARIAGCTILLTEDLAEGPVFDDVTVANPFKEPMKR